MRKINSFLKYPNRLGPIYIFIKRNNVCVEAKIRHFSKESKAWSIKKITHGAKIVIFLEIFDVYKGPFTNMPKIVFNFLTWRKNKSAPHKSTIPMLAFRNMLTWNHTIEYENPTRSQEIRRTHNSTRPLPDVGLTKSSYGKHHGKTNVANKTSLPSKYKDYITLLNSPYLTSLNPSHDLKHCRSTGTCTYRMHDAATHSRAAGAPLCQSLNLREFRWGADAQYTLTPLHDQDQLELDIAKFASCYNLECAWNSQVPDIILRCNEQDCIITVMN